MTATTRYPKRLIEVDLPIRRISVHARREKSIRHGHISTLHIWWARRPLAACRAVICAALWPDPADPLCPDAFRAFAREQMQLWADYNRHLVSKESLPRIELARDNAVYLDNPVHVRIALLDFIADFANWDNSTKPQYLETSRALTRLAHEALGGEPGTRPLVADPFAGGGAIPLEALRVGADAFASDLNPVAVLLNKVVLEHVPKYGQRLAEEVRKRGNWIQEQAEKQLMEFFPKGHNGDTPIAYLWARTIRCEGPSCGAEVPLIHSPWLARRSKNSVALRLVPNYAEKRVDFEITHDAKSKDISTGTIRKGAATCPICGFTTPVASVRQQLSMRSGGTSDALLTCVVSSTPEERRRYRIATSKDVMDVMHASERLRALEETATGNISVIPNEPLPPQGTLGFRVQLYGMKRWGDLFTRRQLLSISTLVRLVREVTEIMLREEHEPAFAYAVTECLALGIDRVADRCSSLCRYDPSPTMSGINNTFARQALPIVWDFAEGYPIGDRSGGWSQCIEWLVAVLSKEASYPGTSGIVKQASATSIPLPDESVQTVVTDPPYYDAVPYADLSDFFYVWIRRCLPNNVTEGFGDAVTPKNEECIVDEIKGKDQDYFLRTMEVALGDCSRILTGGGVGVVVFAHKSTSGWEAQLQAMIDAKWTVTGSWPIDTEMATRLRAHDSAALASSVHLVCRPRESSSQEHIGDWREVLAELPQRIHEWLPRLVAEGIVGADAIFACLGPAVEIFSRYERVEKASGEVVTLHDYLPHVWAAVSREALKSILEGDDASELEDDARLTAIWFWVLKASTEADEGQDVERNEEPADDEADEDDTPAVSSRGKTSGYAMEYDAARKLAQGLGVDLAKLSRAGGIISIRGNVATLHTAASREQYLFGTQLSLFEGESLPISRQSKRARGFSQAELSFVTKRKPTLWAEEHSVRLNPDQPHLPLFGDVADQRTFMQRLIDGGETVLDRLHQAMLLFGNGQTALLAQFLAEVGMGTNPNFWRLAQALSALYPTGSEEKRWVDGVLARKKGWGM